MKIKMFDEAILNVLMVLYITSLFLLALTYSDNFPYIEVFSKIKYVYIITSIVYCAKAFKGKINKHVTFIVGGILGHTLLFGLVFINPIVVEETLNHCFNMIIFLILVIFTYLIVWNEGIIEEFEKWNFVALGGALIFSAITNLGDFVNPLRFINFFSRFHGYRTTFGYSHGNFVGNLCLFFLIYSVFILERMRKKQIFLSLLKNKKAVLIILVDCVVLWMLFSVKSRTSMIALIAFVFIYVIEEWVSLFYSSKSSRRLFIILLLICCFLFLIMGGVSYIWQESNRAMNVEINFPIFRQHNQWIGMGYIDSYGFLGDSFGYDTFALDIFYLYILFTTGYIGSTIIGVIYIYTITNLFLARKRDNNSVSLALFVAMVVSGMGQAHVMNYTLITSMINWIMILLALSKRAIFEN